DRGDLHRQRGSGRGRACAHRQRTAHAETGEPDMSARVRISRRALLIAGAAIVTAPAIVQAQEGAIMRIRLTFADQDFTATLEDNPSARDLVSMLPLDLTVGDYSTNEKIAYLPRKLTEEGSGRFG